MKLIQKFNNIQLLTQERTPIEEEELWQNTNKILYGPVASRRLGESLGINFFIDQKICSLNCIYCDVGFTKGDRVFKIDTIDEVIRQFNVEFEKYAQKIENGLKVDYFTFCGNGELLDHPDFLYIANYIYDKIKTSFPTISSAILTNGHNLWEKDILDFINKLDQKYVKLDAGSETIFNQINRPFDKDFWHKLLQTLPEVQGLSIETAIVSSPKFSNIDDLKSNYINTINNLIENGDVEGIFFHNIDYPTMYTPLKLFTKDELITLIEKIAVNIPVPVYVLSSLITFRKEYKK